jgi:orotidine-5'-phosphate decarboxylase
VAIEKTIIALDFPSLEKVQSFLDIFKDSDTKPIFVKVGMELFYAEGPKIIEYLKEQKLKIFLDLKVHDIPNTALGAISSLAKYGVDILNVHASGGIAMMQKAKEALDGYTCKLIAVTHLTSTDEKMLNEELLIATTIEKAVLNLAENTKKAGLDGIVCSPHEIKIVKEKLGKDFVTVCPGIRLEKTNDDQKRTLSAKEAFALGTDYIVIGRPITQAEDPIKAFDLLLNRP